MRALSVILVGVAACGGGAVRGDRTTTLRPACAVGERWNGASASCQPRGGEAELDAAVAQIANLDIDVARATLDRAAERPLTHASYLRLWEVRAAAAAAVEAPDQAQAAYARLLEADPAHSIDCNLGGKLFRPFQAARAAAARDPAPALELRWPRDLRLGAPVPIEVETVADPTSLMHSLTLYVRARGETDWRATDLDLPAPGEVRELRLPAFGGTAPTAIELFAIASDQRGNEVHLWASPDRPREVPLRYDPPTPWYRTWWVWAAVGGVVAVGTGVGVYAAVWEPSAELDAPISGAR